MATEVARDCQAALDDIGLGIEKNSDMTLSVAFENLQTSFKKVIAVNNPIDALRDVQVLLHRMVSLPSFRALGDVTLSGVPVGLRVQDVQLGVAVLLDHFDLDRDVRKSGILGSTLIKEQKRYAEKLFVDLAQVAITLKSLLSEDDVNSWFNPLEKQADRAVSLARQLAIAGHDTRETVILNLLEALDGLKLELAREVSNTRLDAVGNEIEKIRLSVANLAGKGFVYWDGDVFAQAPEQALAPFQFAINGDVLTLRPQEANSKAGADAIAAAALNALRGIAEDLHEDLEKSNHPRLFRAFKRLQTAMNEGASVVEIGMLCASFEGQVGAAAEELSESLLALLSGFVKGVNDYASQFEEWQDFSDNAAEANFTPLDAETYTEVARALAAELERRHEVDERVPEALRQVADWNARGSTPRSRLSIGRTVLNLIAVCYTEMVAKPVKTAVGTIGTVVGVAIGGAAGAAVAAIVLNQASIHIAELAKPPEAAWLRPASKVIDAHLKKLEKP